MKTILLILLTLKVSAHNGDGSTKHFYASAFGSVVISELTYRITDRPALSAFTGAVLMFGVGYCKERFHDKSISQGDLFNDGFGSATGSICWAVHFDITDRGYKKRQREFIKLNNAKRLLE